VLGLTRILAFGDSMTEGVTQPAYTPPALTAGLPVSYPYKLQDLLTARYTSQTIVALNAGIAGKRAQEDRSRLHDANRANEDDPAEVRKTIDLTAYAMDLMVRDANDRGVKVMLATLPPQRPGGRNAGAVTFLGRYNDELKKVAAKDGAMLIDVNTQFPLELIGEDGLHPTDVGYDKLAQIFRDAIAAAYEIVPASLSR
jgi:lysophospholipase L1-like esterase